MATIKISLNGRINPPHSGYRVVIDFLKREGIRKITSRIPNTLADGSFSGTITIELATVKPGGAQPGTRITRSIPGAPTTNFLRSGQIAFTGSITGNIKVLDSTGTVVYTRENHRFAAKPINNLRITIPPSSPEQREVKISGKLIPTAPDKLSGSYNISFSTKVGRRIIEFGSTSSNPSTGKFKFTKVFDLSETQNLPERAVCYIKVSKTGKEIKGTKPNQIILSKSELKDVEIRIPLQKFKIILHFKDKDTGEDFKDKLSVKFSDGRVWSQPFQVNTGKLETEIIPGLGNTISLEVNVIDRFSRKKLIYSGGFIIAIDNSGTVTQDILLKYPTDDPYKINMLRPADMLVLDFNFQYLGLKRGKLEPAFKGKDGLMIVTFPPQAFAEKAFFEVDPNIPVPLYDENNNPIPNSVDPEYEFPDLPESPVKALISGKSRLAFKIKEGESFKYSLEGLLQAMCDLELNICLPAKDTWQLIIPPHLEGINDRLSLILGQFKSSKKGLYHKAYFTEKHKGFLQNIVHIKPPQKAPGIKPVNPNKEETSIEAPYRLIISPHQHSGWLHKTGAIMPDTIKPVELWHSKLIVKDAEELHSNSIRAIWALDPGFTQDVKCDKDDDNDNEKNSFRMSLDAFDRKNIVHLTSNRSIKKYTPSPVNVENLMLTALGAFMNVKGGWEPPEELSVEEWQHRASLGRDHFVKVVYKGYLFPFGHRASLVKITERKLIDNIFVRLTGSAKEVYQKTNDRSISGAYHKIAREELFDLEDKKVKEIPALIESFSKKASDLTKKKTKTVAKQNQLHNQLVDSFSDLLGGILSDPVLMKNSWVAILKQRMFIIVREEEKLYESGQPAVDRQWPFFCLRIKTLVTPNLDNPTNSAVYNYGLSVFWPYVDRHPFPFVIEAEDLHGNILSFSSPVIFVENTYNKKPILDNALIDYNNDTGGTNKNKILLYGQSIRFAEASNNNTSFDTKSITFSAAIANDDNDYGTRNPNFYPQIKEAEVEIPALKVLLGENGIATINFFHTYIQHEFDNNNKGEVFAKVTNEPLINFSNHGDKAGGIIQPNIKITGLSRLLGPVGGDLGDLAAGDFKPKSYFEYSSAKIFGSIDLWNILEPNIKINESNINDRKIPQIVSNSISDLGFTWRPDLVNWADIFEPLTDASMEVNLNAKVQPGSFVKTFSCTSKIKNFTIELLGDPKFIRIQFKRITFESQPGQTAKIEVEINEIKFLGVLQFVMKLNSLIHPGKFKDKPYIDISEKGITSGFALSLPNVEVGVLNLQNLSLANAFSIPFSGEPLSLRFSFCEKHNPFMLTVSMFGGSGYFGIVLSPGGLLMMEAAFEFGAGIAMNFGVASGNVSIMAGIYFVMEKTEDEQFSVVLTGYLRINGNVRVLGIVNASILLLMALEYQTNYRKCVGRAVLIVEVSVLLFSASVEIACEKKFAGSEGDPTFEQIMEPYYDEMKQKNVKPWEDYCNAFAF